jgi:glycosyltransferase involved in cell wall biosynthesis
MRILLVMDEINCGGAEMSFFALCRALAKRCDVELGLSEASLKNPVLRALSDSLSTTSVVVHRSRVSLYPGTLANLHSRLRRAAAEALAEVILRARPDVVVVNLPTVERGQSVIDAAESIRPRVPVWGFLHSSNPPSTIGAKLGRVRDALVPALLRRFDHLLTVSSSGARAVVKRYRVGSPDVVYPPIETVSGFSVPERDAARAAAGLPEGLLLGIVGRLAAAHKGQDIALRVTRRLRTADVPVHLLIIGDGPDRPALEHLARQLQITSHVSFLGWRQDAGQLIALLDALVIASRHEGMPLTALQAAAASVPVVGYAVDGLTELLPPDFHIPYGDEDGLVTTLRELLRGARVWPSEELAERARNWADPEAAAERLVGLLRSSLPEGRPRSFRL